jgi:hypothetical protein
MKYLLIITLQFANNTCTHAMYYRHFLCFSANPKQATTSWAFDALHLPKT